MKNSKKKTEPGDIRMQKRAGVCEQPLGEREKRLVQRAYALFDSFSEQLREESSVLVSKVLAYIGEHYAEEVSLESLAGQFFVSKYHLSHEFSRTVGVGVYRYLTLKRLLIAKQLMDDGVPPGDVYAACGFRDYTNFYRAFKAEYGISPRACGVGKKN